MKVAAVMVPFFRAAGHRRWAEDVVRSLRTRYELDRIAVVNALRDQTDDEQWVRQAFDHVIMNDRNVLARAWNRGICCAFERGADYALVMNMDVVLHSSCIDNLCAAAREDGDPVMWSATRWYG